LAESNGRNLGTVEQLYGATDAVTPSNHPAWRNRLAGILAGGRASRAEATKSGLEVVKWAEDLILA